MPVYVDDLIDYVWSLGQSCHMLADTEQELHEFAITKLGFKRSWFQSGDDHTLPHYDLTKGKRFQAVKAGAIEINRDQLIERIKKYKDENSINYKKE